MIHKKALFYALLAALLYGISAPLSKSLLTEIPPLQMAALLYLGAGIGMLFIHLLSKQTSKESNLSVIELPFVIAMVVLDIAAPLFFMVGLKSTSAAHASLLNNFEIVATAVIALIFFKEQIGKRSWIAIIWITLASMLLSLKDVYTFTLSNGSLLILLATLLWGLENNCSRALSLKNPIQIVIIKGLGSGIGASILVFILGDISFKLVPTLLALVLGFFSYGLSIYFYVSAQRTLGAAKTSAYYAIAPFIGVGLSILIYDEALTGPFILATGLMLLGTYYITFEKHGHLHTHETFTHDHRHTHDDGHHTHTHVEAVENEHSHVHIHEPLSHSHEHSLDIHHRHLH